MKFTRIILLLITLLGASSYAKSPEEADIPKDLQSILGTFRFVYGDSTWKPVQDTALSDASVFAGSAYCIFDEPVPAPSNYIALAQQIRDGFQKIYDLKASRSGAGGVQTATFSEKSGEAHFTWTDVHGDDHRSKASITLSVRVVPLRDARLGIILNYIRVRPGA